MRRSVSIGTRWTLRYTAALLVTVSIFAAYTYSRVVTRTERDAELHLELQVKEIARAIRDSWATAPSVIDIVERNIGRVTTLCLDMLHYALGVFFGLHDQMLRAQVRGGRIHKGLPLARLHDTFYRMGYHSHS